MLLHPMRASLTVQGFALPTKPKPFSMRGPVMLPTLNPASPCRKASRASRPSGQAFAFFHRVQGSAALPGEMKGLLSWLQEEAEFACGCPVPFSGLQDSLPLQTPRRLPERHEELPLLFPERCQRNQSTPCRSRPGPILAAAEQPP